MTQRIPGPGEEILPLPDFHDDVDIFAGHQAAHPRRSRIRMMLTVLMLLLLLAGVVVLVIRYRTHIIYQMQKVTQGDVVLNFNAPGSLRTNVYTINFTGSGKLAEINVSIGQQIKKNQILAKMDPTSLQNAVNEAQANVDAAQTLLDNANENYRAIQVANPAVTENQQFAAAAVARTSDGGPGRVNITTTSPEGGTLPTPDTAPPPGITPQTIGPYPRPGTTPQAIGPYSQPGTTPQTIPRPGTSPQAIGPYSQPGTTQVSKQVQLTEAAGQVKAAQKALVLARTQLASAKYNLNNMVLKAPHDGTVAAINGAVGGGPGAPFIQLTDSSLLQLQANVDESNIGSVTVGDAVTFAVDAYPDQSFDGNVVAITPLSQMVAGKVTYPVLVNMTTSVPDTVHLLSGMTVHATIITDQRADVAKVPVKAITFAHASLKARAETDNRNLVSHAQMDDALARANILLQNLQQDATTQGRANPAVVLGRDAYGNIVVIPIVVGLTDGTQYEVLDGLSTNDVVVVGAQTSNG